MFSRMKASLSGLAKNWAMTQQVFRLLPLEVGGFFLVGFLVLFVPVFLLLNWFTAGILGLAGGLMAGTFWFGRRAMAAAYSQIEGQPGAAAAVIQSQRGGNWVVTPGAAVSKNQDVISRVVGKPGVILISEGPSKRVQPMLAVERKRTSRFVPEIPIYDIQVGSEEGQIPLGKLMRTLNKLPRNLRGGEITAVRRRVEALGNAATNMPIPKGPMPTSSRQARRPR